MVIEATSLGHYLVNLRHYDDNGHNFGVMQRSYNKNDVSAVEVILPNQEVHNISALWLENFLRE